jgi:hypothetical protein
MRLPLTINKLIISFCLLILSGSALLAQKVIKVDSSHVMTLRVDPSNAVGGVASDFFTEVNYIPLETTKESLFGSISQLEITEDYYIIFDYNTHCILLFTKAGKFHTKIKSTESSPIYNFSINKWTKQIIFSRDRYKTLTYCDYDGKVVNSVKLGGETAKDEIGNYGLNLFSPDKGFTNSWYNNIDSTSKDYRVYHKSLIVFANANHKVYAYGLPFTKAENELEIMSNGGQWPISKFGVDTAFFFSKAYDSAIYTITPNAITLSYKFIFPLYASLPKDFLSNTDYNKKRIEWIEKHNQTIFCLTNFFRIGNNLVFRTGTWGSNNKEDNLIYNLKTGTTIAYKHIQQDERSYFMPIYDPTGYTFDNNGILGCAGGSLYTSVSAVGMYKAYNDNAEQKVKYPPALAEYFKKGSIKDNPAILQLKLKDEL